MTLSSDQVAGSYASEAGKKLDEFIRCSQLQARGSGLPGCGGLIAVF